MDTARSRPASLAWKLAFFLPLAAAVALQVISRTQADLHSGVKLSIIGNVFLSFSLIAQAVYFMRRSALWGTLMLVLCTGVLAFGLYVLLRAL